MSLIVRSITPDDYTAWRPLWDGYNAHYERWGPTALPEAITQSTWSRFFDDGEPVHALVAESEGELLGLAHYLFHRSTLQVESACYLQDLFTGKAARGRGVGRALIEGVSGKARAAGCSSVYWHTREYNQTARQLYDQVATLMPAVVYRKIF